MRMPRKKQTEEGVAEYQKTRILTSGAIQSHIMLCAKALILMKDLNNFYADEQRQAQNIIYQLQRALNIKRPDSAEIYKALAVIWDAIDHGNHSDLVRATKILDEYHQTLKAVAGIEQATQNP